MPQNGISKRTVPPPNFKQWILGQQFYQLLHKNSLSLRIHAGPSQVQSNRPRPRPPGSWAFSFFRRGRGASESCEWTIWVNLWPPCSLFWTKVGDLWFINKEPLWVTSLQQRTTLDHFHVPFDPPRRRLAPQSRVFARRPAAREEAAPPHRVCGVGGGILPHTTYTVGFQTGRRLR